MKIIPAIVLFSFLPSLFSCRKFVAVDPPTNQVTSETVFTSEATARATVNGIYIQMMNDPNQFTSGLTTFYAGLAADELAPYSPGNLEEFRLNKISLANHAALQSGFWQPAYKYIYTANLILEGLAGATTVPAAAREGLMGEARFVRAFCYFYLVNLFGDVPLVTRSNYLDNANLARAPKEIVYQQILDDLKEAQQGLPADHPAGEKSKPNKWAATALLARTYLYLKDWNNAKEAAGAVLNSGQFSLSPLKTSFTKNSSEAIWQLQPVNPDLNTYEAWTLLPSSPTSLPTYTITPELLTAFEAGDERKAAWDSAHFYNGSTVHIPSKYKENRYNAPLTEYYTVLRLAEVLLIHAEAAAHLSHTSDALASLNLVRARAGLADLPALAGAPLFQAIEQERRIELFAEWGHRWLDLKRTGRVDAVLGPIKPTWSPLAALWPVPQNEINLNPALTQNPGY